jgi:hypothetical protein
VTRYVPILRTKLAEWTALRELTDDVRKTILPCLELLPQELIRVGDDTADNLPQGVRQFAKRIRRTWGPRPVLIDASHLAPLVRRDTFALLACFIHEMCTDMSTTGPSAATGPRSGAGR